MIELQEPVESQILLLPLKGLVEPDCVLTLNRELGTLLLLRDNRLMVEAQFSAGELRILLPVLEHYPDYCPYEVLLAFSAYARVTDAEIDRCRVSLHQAREVGESDFLMRPVRNVLARAKIKLRTFGIDISSILEIGYMLRKVTKMLEDSER